MASKRCPHDFGSGLELARLFHEFTTKTQRTLRKQSLESRHAAFLSDGAASTNIRQTPLIQSFVAFVSLW